MRKPKILIADDDAFSRVVVASKLRTIADVIEAEDGQDALHRLQTSGVDLAVLDLEMPIYSGLDLIKILREHPTLRHMPVIVLTADETGGTQHRALMAGATSFLRKAQNWTAFGTHVRHVLELAFRAGHMAHHDHLTQLPNRVLLDQKLEQALGLASPHFPVAVHALDLDRFKVVNDTLGHAAGDKLLKLVSDRLLGLMRDADCVARLGGDEFAIVQVGLARHEDAALLARRVIDAVSEPYDLGGQRVHIGTTVGIAIVSERGHRSEQVIRNADIALYRAKLDGRGTVRFFDDTMGFGGIGAGGSASRLGDTPPATCAPTSATVN